MNDVNSTVVDGVSDLTCTCSIFTTLMQVASLGLSEEEFDETDLSNVQCCHMRVFNELISDHMLSVIQQKSRSENSLVRRLELSVDNINEKFRHLPTSSDRVLKFSVFSKHDKRCVFVHITGNRLSCQSGYCDALFPSSKRLIVHLDKADVLCPHLKQMKKFKADWQDLVPKADDTMEIGNVNEDGEDPVEQEDQPVAETPVLELKGHRFNEESGLWEYPSLSPHPPAADGSVHLEAPMQERATYTDRSMGRDEDGYLYTREGGNLKELWPPQPPESCKCGAGYQLENGMSLSLSHITKVYMMHGPAKYKIFTRVCRAKNPNCNIGPGEKDAIHFFTKETGAGDEIGWDFEDHVLLLGLIVN